MYVQRRDWDFLVKGNGVSDLLLSVTEDRMKSLVEHLENLQRMEQYWLVQSPNKNIGGQKIAHIVECKGSNHA